MPPPRGPPEHLIVSSTSDNILDVGSYSAGCGSHSAKAWLSDALLGVTLFPLSQALGSDGATPPTKQGTLKSFSVSPTSKKCLCRYEASKI